jgi:hypothetical protein
MNYKNQKRIEIKQFNSIVHKEGTKDSFLQPINWEYYDEALKKLNGNAFKLWLYLLRWVGKGYYDFSPTNLCEALNIGSKNTILAMKEELIREKYLISVSENIYYFYPCGHADLIYQNMTIE